MSNGIAVVFPIYAGVTQLDFTAPHQVLARIAGTTLQVASVDGAPVAADGLNFAGLARLQDIERCDVLCVPGGRGIGDAIQNRALLEQLRRLAANARYLGSVCNGSLLLAAAGLLEGRRVACHWAWRDLLARFGAIPDPARVVRDGHVFSGGGVTAGIDFALALASELTDPATAQLAQLLLEYAPEPPFDAGRPETAPPQVLERAQRQLAEVLAAHRAIVEQMTAA